jgi:SAM-dependent methyltransferase
VLRGLAHASLLFAVAHLPGGRRAYHGLTRGLLGSQARVLRKLQRVWPGYAGVWRDRCGLALEGATVWVHEPGWVPFAPLASYLLTGSGGLVTSSSDRPSDAYVGAAVRAALAARFPLEGAAADLCHTGGALEHYPPARLAAFLRESFRILRPGGVASHVYDHRDHLRHVDPTWPFLLHMALPESAYRTLLGHPLLFHNRLAPREVMAMFEAAGFERIAVRRFVLPDKRYVDGNARGAGEAGVPDWLASGRLDQLTTEDRHTAAIHYLYRRPER